MTATPTGAGQPARVRYRPTTASFAVRSRLRTSAAGSDTNVTLSNGTLIECMTRPNCTGTIGGFMPVGYRAPFTGSRTLVRTFRVEQANEFARTAFVEALRRRGVRVDAPTLGANPRGVLPSRDAYPSSTRVAQHTSAPYSQTIRLVLKVSLNLGANTALSLFGRTKGTRTIKGSLAAERRELINRYGIPGSQFRFPTNGSGSPDSQASPSAFMTLLRAMSRTPP